MFPESGGQAGLASPQTLRPRSPGVSRPVSLGLEPGQRYMPGSEPGVPGQHHPQGWEEGKREDVQMCSGITGVPTIYKLGVLVKGCALDLLNMSGLGDWVIPTSVVSSLTVRNTGPGTDEDLQRQPSLLLQNQRWWAFCTHFTRKHSKNGEKVVHVGHMRVCRIKSTQPTHTC